MVDKTSNFILERIADALERLAPPNKKINNLDQSEGFIAVDLSFSIMSLGIKCLLFEVA